MDAFNNFIQCPNYIVSDLLGLRMNIIFSREIISDKICLAS